MDRMKTGFALTSPSPAGILLILSQILLAAFSTLPSNHTFSPSWRNRSASGRTTALSSALWLRKTSQVKTGSLIGRVSCLLGFRRGIIISLSAEVMQADFAVISRRSNPYRRRNLKRRFKPLNTRNTRKSGSWIRSGTTGFL